MLYVYANPEEPNDVDHSVSYYVGDNTRAFLIELLNLAHRGERIAIQADGDEWFFCKDVPKDGGSQRVPTFSRPEKVAAIIHNILSQPQ